jgi:hypothetical protein
VPLYGAPVDAAPWFDTGTMDAGSDVPDVRSDGSTDSGGDG